MNKVPTFSDILFLEQASTIAPQIDAMYWVLVVITIFFTVAILAAIVFMAAKYRRKSSDQVGEDVRERMWVEVTWSVIPGIIALAIFVWSAKVFMFARTIPEDSLEIAAVGKQWMWKFQHPDGMREINELHVPKGKPIHVRSISQDVLHSLFVPAFRVKQDLVPGYFTSLWFEATKVGKYKLHCAEYCGKDHSVMGGFVYVMEPADYEKWLMSGTGMQAPLPLAGPDTVALPSSGKPAAKGNAIVEGKRLFGYLACASCHQDKNSGQGPSLTGIFGKRVALQDGSTVLADDNYIRESVINPMAKVVAGYQPVMPSFQGRVTEEDILSLIAYIRSIRGSK